MRYEAGEVQQGGTHSLVGSCSCDHRFLAPASGLQVTGMLLSIGHLLLSFLQLSTLQLGYLQSLLRLLLDLVSLHRLHTAASRPDGLTATVPLAK